MSSSFTLLVVLLTLCLRGNHAQRNDERDLPPEKYLGGRSAKPSFDGQFPRGRCPERFIQLGEECLYFSTDGKIYSWNQAERACRTRISRLLNQPGSSVNVEQPNMSPARGVRQMVLNTPEKTEILRALFRDYNDQNFAVRLPADYNSLPRCRDGKDDRWPQFCTAAHAPNRSCVETLSTGSADICLREVDCQEGDLRLACEFTLPGSSELTTSRFRVCPKRRGLRHRLPLWAWITIIVGGSLLLLIILGVIVGVVCKKKNGGSSNARSLPIPHQADEKIVRVLPKREDPAAEPMLTRIKPNPETDTGYLQPRSTPIANTPNA